MQTTAQKAAGDLGLPGSHCGGGRVSTGRKSGILKGTHQFTKQQCRAADALPGKRRWSARSHTASWWLNREENPMLMPPAQGSFSHPTASRAAVPVLPLVSSADPGL